MGMAFHSAIFLAISACVAFAAANSPSCPTSTFAKLPKNAQGPPISNVTGYRLEHYGHGAYMVTDGIYQSMFFVACESVIAVDAPPTIGRKLIDAIRSVTSKPVSHVVYSHAHADHIGGAYLYGVPPNVTVIAHSLTAQELSLAPDANRRPAPTITFHSSYTLQVCNQTLNLVYEGPNHEPGNIFIYSATAKTLMVVDIVFPGWVPFAYLGEAQSVPGYIVTHERILDYDFKHYVGGHLDHSGNRHDVLASQEYVLDLYKNCAEAIRLSAAPPNVTNSISVYTLLPPVESMYPGNSWALFGVYLDAVSGYCANQTNMKWGGILGGADVFGQANAYAMIESIRIDYDILGPFGLP